MKVALWDVSRVDSSHYEGEARTPLGQGTWTRRVALWDVSRVDSSHYEGEAWNRLGQGTWTGRRQTCFVSVLVISTDMPKRGPQAFTRSLSSGGHVDWSLCMSSVMAVRGMLFHRIRVRDGRERHLHTEASERLQFANFAVPLAHIGVDQWCGLAAGVVVFSTIPLCTCRMRFSCLALMRYVALECQVRPKRV